MKAISRAESLADAIAGNFTYINRGATQVLLGGSNASSSEFCVNWEGNNIWLDGEGYFHSIAHAWDGRPSDYPQVDGKGCCTQPAIGYANESMAAAECNRIAGYRCTAYGGHTYSMDGLVWYVSPVPAYTNAIRYTEGSVVEYKARERPHLIFDDNNEPLLLGNAVCLSRRNWMDTGFLIGHDHSFVQLVPLNSKSDDVAAKLIAAAGGLAGSSPLSAAASTDGMYWLESPLSKVLVNDTAPANWSRHWPLPVAGGDSPSGAPQLGKGNGQDSGSEPRGPVLGIDLAAQTGEAEAWQVALRSPSPAVLSSVSVTGLPTGASLKWFKVGQLWCEQSEIYSLANSSMWQPDVLLPPSEFADGIVPLDANLTHSVWLRLHVGAGIAPGLYNATVSLEISTSAYQSRRLTVPLQC